MAEERVRERGRDGSFIVRDASKPSERFPYSLTVFYAGKTFNLNIRLRCVCSPQEVPLRICNALVSKLTARFKMRSLPLFHQILLDLHFLKAIKKIKKKSIEPFLKKSIFSLSDGKSLFLAKTDGRWLSFLSCSFFLG